MAAHVDPMLLQLRDSIACLGQPLRPPVVAGLGLGAAVAASAALFQPGVLRSAIALDGPLPEAWRSQSVVRPEERALYMATLQGTPEYARLAVAAQQLAQRGVRTKLVPLDRGAPLLPADVTSAWLWADGATSRSRGR
jgi:pimeloyl-ACP methyl ester carboxylesterase